MLRSCRLPSCLQRERTLDDPLEHRPGFAPAGRAVRQPDIRLLLREDIGKVAVALLDWQLKGDKDAGKMFQGANCGLCQNPKWHVEKKGIK